MNENVPIRRFPAFIILTLIILASFVPAMIAPRTMIHFGGMAGGWLLSIVATIIWWAAFSRVTGLMRWLPVVIFCVISGIAVAMYPNSKLGMNILLCCLLAITLWLVAVVITSFSRWPATRTAVIMALIISLAATLSIRIDGTSADLIPELSLRWQKTAEQLAMEDRIKTGSTKPPVELKIGPSDWPQFRGVNQDSKVIGSTIRTNWEESPPQEVWKRRIGPSWGTFAVVGDFLFTQEQRGENESVVCLKADNGAEVWSYETAGRFAEAISGVGPRATPTVSNDSVFAFGATGKLTRLNALTGEKIWEVDTPAATQTTAPPQFWGYASSPFIWKNLVIVFINGGAAGKGTAAFNISDGSVAWAGGIGNHGYCTAHRAVLAGVEQLLMPSDKALESFDPQSGKILWTYNWPTRGNRSTQPILLGNDELLLPTGYGIGTQRLKITKSGESWNVENVWESKKLKPYYNDAVLHNGYVFGFDDSAFVCIDPANGKQKWSAGTKYGFGQVLLLADQNLLLVMAERGQVALVEANGDDYVELTKFQALQGKTWNHPVVNRGKLYVRNGVEMACFDLSTK